MPRNVHAVCPQYVPAAISLDTNNPTHCNTATAKVCSFLQWWATSQAVKAMLCGLECCSKQARANTLLCPLLLCMSSCADMCSEACPARVLWQCWVMLRPAHDNPCLETQAASCLAKGMSYIATAAARTRRCFARLLWNTYKSS